jgi:hypothetical protein
MEYYEWTSVVTGQLNKVRANPYYPVSNECRFKEDFQENISDSYDYNGEPVWLTRNNSPVERIA